MLLEAIELALHSEKTESISLAETLTVEHVMPQEWTRHWPLPESENEELAELERTRLIHTLGNLTLVNRKLNPSLSNGPWVKKRDGLAEHSVLLLNSRLIGHEVWDEAAIRTRGMEASKIACRIWPIPEESTVTGGEDVGLE